MKVKFERSKSDFEGKSFKNLINYLITQHVPNP